MKNTAFFGLLVAMLLAFTIGCGGVGSDTRLSDLQADERTEVCDGFEGAEAMCDDSTTVSIDGEECEETLEALEGSDCAATVGDFDSCNDDACSEGCMRVVGCAIQAAFNQ